MKLQFKNQDFQTAAVNAITDLFAGQEHTRATFSVMDEGQLLDQTSYLPAQLGTGNVLRLSDEALAENMIRGRVSHMTPTYTYRENFLTAMSWACTGCWRH